MSINKITLNGVPQIDISDTNILATDVTDGKVFYGANGEKITGSGDTFSLDNALARTLHGDVTTNITGRLYNLDFNYTAITSFSAPNATELGIHFEHCEQLRYVRLPNALYYISQNNSFDGCSALEEYYAPKQKGGLGDYTYQNCTSLKKFVLPSLENLIYTGTLKGCINLETVDFGVGGYSFGRSNVFLGCSKLATLILRRLASVCPLANTNNFGGTPFASGGTGGTLYVPQDLISAYQSATNWSTILSYPNNQILPIEGSIYENEYADGTPVV